MADDMLTVLVADDELPLREELRMFPWEAYGFERIGEADNGEDALAFCRAYAPDVVITDITMPVMDGLALFRTLKRELPGTQIILLTCHSEFAYAQEAVQLGAVDYLVKVTMKPGDLINALRKAKDGYAQDRLRLRSETEKRRWELSRRLALRAKGLSPEEAGVGMLLQRELGAGLPVCMAGLHVVPKRENRLLAKREVEEALIRLERTWNFFLWVPAADGVYVLFRLPESIDPGGMVALTRGIASVIEQKLPFLSETVRVYAVDGEPVREEDGFRRMYRMVIGEHPAYFYDSGSRVYDAADGGEDAWRPEQSAIAEMTDRLRRCKGERERLADCLRNDLAQWATTQKVHPELLKSLIAAWRSDWLNGSGSASRAKAIAEASSLEELVAILVHEIETDSGETRKLRKEINDAMRYIADHLAQPITLAAVAEHVGLSPHYLCRLFPEETGVSFNGHILKQRMEKAEYLLKTTSLRVYEVAVAVGVPSYRYFAAIFREHFGISPTSFKKSL